MEEYLDCIQAIAGMGLEASVTVKLTALGALFDRETCRKNALTILRGASAANVGFEMDMEGRDLVEFTLQVADACAREGSGVTLALQAYLDRTPGDLKAVLKGGVRPRIVKGAYAGDTSDFVEIQQRFRELAGGALERGAALIGTHDPELIAWLLKSRKIAKGKAEFGFLKGLADRTKVDLARQGWLVSEYVPFGGNKEAYEARRMRYLSELRTLGREPAP
jgi:proline dehydrogenase